MNTVDVASQDAKAFVVVVSGKREQVSMLNVFTVKQMRDVDSGGVGDVSYHAPTNFILEGFVSRDFRGATAQDVADFVYLRQRISSTIESDQFIDALQVAQALPGIQSLNIAWELWTGICGALFEGIWRKPDTKSAIRKAYRKFLKLQK